MTKKGHRGEIGIPTSYMWKRLALIQHTQAPPLVHFALVPLYHRYCSDLAVLGGKTIDCSCYFIASETWVRSDLGAHAFDSVSTTNMVIGMHTASCADCHCAHSRTFRSIPACISIGLSRLHSTFVRKTPQNYTCNQMVSQNQLRSDYIYSWHEPAFVFHLLKITVADPDRFP